MNLPEEFIARMKVIDGFDIDGFLNSYNYPPYTGVRINPAKKNSHILFEKEFKNNDQVPWCKDGYYIEKEHISGNHPYHIAGMLYFQEPSAMCTAEMVPVEDGDFILDLCAAPGGKSTQIAAKNKNITLISNEIIPKRAKILSENIERMGFSNVIVTNESPERLENHFPNFFDKIIIDAPCSGEGMFKKEAAAVESWSVEHVEACSNRQKKIIDSAMKMLKPGGYIAYSTCTFAEEENENNVEYIITKYPYMEVINTTKLYPHTSRGEGHFAALIRDSRPKEKSVCTNYNIKNPDKEISLFKDFESKYLNSNLKGEFILFGENLYLKPADVNISGIRVIRPGLHLGVCKKNRFEPAHALCKALEISHFKNVVNFTLSDNMMYKYLKGETIPGDIKGFCAIACNGLPLGWCKGSDGILKNKFPKGLRIY